MNRSIGAPGKQERPGGIGAADMSWREFRYFPPSTPRAAKGGIKAQSKRGEFGESWWAKRWVEALESFDIGARLGRGRSYARRGQVLSIDIEKGMVKARVQGSRARPYEVHIKVKPLSEVDWKKIAKALSSQVIFAAKLLSGEMPQDIERIFKQAGLSLFPEKRKDLETECSCPDWSNPCKHIAAVYLLLGEEFDRNPFLIFKLRGKGREELLSELGEGKERHGGRPAGKDAAAEAGKALLPLDRIQVEGNVFWEGSNLAEDFFGEVSVPPLGAALLKRLGGFPFWRADRSLQDTLEPVFREASKYGIEVFLGESERGAESSDSEGANATNVRRS